MANVSLKSLLVEVSNPKLEKIVKQTLGSKVRLEHFKDKMWIVAPGDFYSKTRLNQMVDDLIEAIPAAMLAAPVGDRGPIRLGTGGATEGFIVIKLK